jgi:uncharacterized protein (DUF1697 family)
VALLRGVNVGGRKLAMSDLRGLCDEAGCTEVQTYIQSGNVVFSHARGSSDKLRADLEQRIEQLTGYHSAVMLRTAQEWSAVVRGNPFKNEDGTKVHVAFMNDTPDAKALAAVDLASFAPEELVLKSREVYLHLPNGLGRAKLPQVLNKLKTPVTVRNWNTVLKLQAMLKLA